MMEHKPFLVAGVRSFLPVAAVSAAVIAVLYIISTRNYLLFHSIIEFFSIIVAFGIFMTGWNARGRLAGSFLPFLGIAYLFVASLDFMHTLSYAGMGVFTGYTSNLPTQLWIAARSMEALSLFASAFLINRRIGYGPVFALYFIWTLFITDAIFFLNIFPTCYIEGIGLTSFKKTSEYMISTILLITAGLVYARRDRFEKGIFALFLLSIILTILSEIAFVFYFSVYGFSNMVGHIFKLFSFYLIYRAIIQKGIHEPYELIFRDLKQSEESLTRLNEELEARVTERTADLGRANAALRESEARYMDLYENAPDMFLSVDAKTARIIGCNATMARVTGYSKEEIIGRPVFEMYHPGCVKHVKNTVFPRFIKTGEVRNEELRVLRKDGTTIDVMLNTTAVRDKTGSIIYSRSIWRDITERKRAEEALRESEEKFRSMFQTSRDFMAVTDLSGTIIDVNMAAEEFSGYSLEEITGLKMQDLYANPEDRQTLIQEVIESGYVMNSEMKFKRKSGEIINALITITVRRDKDDNPIGFFRTAKDITEKKRMERQIQQTEKLSTIGTMISGVAHELNNPLTSIIGYAELLVKKDIPEDVKDKLAIILKESVRSSKIVGGLLAFAREHKPERKMINLNNTIMESIKLREYDFMVSNIDMRLSLSDDLPETSADPYQIQQVFINLINNARDALVGRDRGALAIRSSRKGDAVLVEFEDNGPGIPDQFINNIFDPFFTTKETGKGTGLGLSMAYGIIKKHGGIISVESKVGKGTKFVVAIPITQGAQSEAREVTVPVKLPPGIKAILVIEDEESLRKFLFEALTNSGFFVEVALTGEQAIDLIEQIHYDAVISDIRMPGIGGRELYLYIQKHHPEIANKIIFITGDILSKDTQSFLQITDSRFIEKPFNLEVLLGALNDVLS